MQDWNTQHKKRLTVPQATDHNLTEILARELLLFQKVKSTKASSTVNKCAAFNKQQATY